MVEDFELMPHEAVSFVVEREKEVQEWNEQKMPKVLPGNSGGRLPGRSTKEAGRERRLRTNAERKVRNEIVQEVVAGIEGKAKAQVDDKPIAQRTVGHSAKQNGDCSQIENEEEEEGDWQKEDRMKMQWEEDEKLQEISERGRAEGVPMQAELLQGVPDLAAQERMSQSNK